MRRKISLKQAVDFHGHLGPYLVLGLLMGDYALTKLRARPHFGLKVMAWGVKDKPRSCLIDGLQLSTGCTYGKGNIRKHNGKFIKASFLKLNNNKSVDLSLRSEISRMLSQVRGHKRSENLARKIFSMQAENIFILK